jgi:ribosomal protein S27E
MKQKLQDKLYEKYPDLFYERHLDMTQTAMCWGISCGDGWYNILDTLCGLISNEIERPHKYIERYTKALSSPNLKEDMKTFYIEQIQKEKEKIIDPIRVTQVKEKFGTLRFYTNCHNNKIDNYITFAEQISEVTCEICGAPGTINDGGWLKVRCQKHKED